MKLAWGARLTPGQRAFVIAMAQALGTDPSANTSVVAFESDWNPQAINEATGASGLIQFMPRTAIGMGTTVEAIRQLNVDEQLPLCYQYWKPYAGRMATLSDCYMAVLWPAAIGEPEDAVIFPAGSKAYLQNRGLDINHDNAVTKAEAAAFVAKRLVEGMQPGNVYDDEAGEASQPQAEGATMGIFGTNAAQGIGGVISLFNPVVGGIISALGPLVQTKLAGAINKHTDDPAVGQQIANQFSTFLTLQAQALTGKADPFQAAAAIVGDPAHAGDLQALSDNLDAQLERMTKAGDKATTWNQAMWTAENAGKQTVSSIAIAEKQAGLWDMTRFIVCSLLTMLWGIAWGLLGSVIYLAIRGDADKNPAMLTALIGLAGPIWTGAIVTTVVAIVAYRFDGSKQQTEQSKALMAQAQQNNRPATA